MNCANKLLFWAVLWVVMNALVLVFAQATDIEDDVVVNIVADANGIAKKLHGGNEFLEVEPDDEVTITVRITNNAAVSEDVSVAIFTGVLNRDWSDTINVPAHSSEKRTHWITVPDDVIPFAPTVKVAVSANGAQSISKLKLGGMKDARKRRKPPVVEEIVVSQQDPVPQEDALIEPPVNEPSPDDNGIAEENDPVEEAADSPSLCIPSNEVCDGIDNDCDGQIDEAITRTCFDFDSAMDFKLYGPGIQTCTAGQFGPCSRQEERDTFESGENIFTKGSLTGITGCSTGQSYLTFFLKEPAGGIFPLFIHDSETEESQEDTNPATYLTDLLHSYTARFSMGLDNSPGKYEFIADVPYTCWEYLVPTADGYRAYPVSWRGDRVKNVPFILDKNVSYNFWNPQLPINFKGPTTVTAANTFEMNKSAQVSLHANGKNIQCEINGNLVHSAGENLIDITEFAKTGQNTVSCSATAGISTYCTGTYQGNDNCGCWFFNGRRKSCPENVVCGTLSHNKHKCWIPEDGYLDVSVSTHPSSDVFWSNDGTKWYYGKLPLKEYVSWRTSPNRYTGSETINEGIYPWSNGQLFVRNWFFADGNHTLRFSYPGEAECTLNNNPLVLEPNIDAYWNFKSEASLSGKNLLACTLTKGASNFFDVSIVDANPISIELLQNQLQDGIVQIPIKVSSPAVTTVSLFVHLNGESDFFVEDLVDEQEFIAELPANLPGEQELNVYLFDETRSLSYEAKTTINLDEQAVSENENALFDTIMLLFNPPATRALKFVELMEDEARITQEQRETIQISNEVWRDHVRYVDRKHNERRLYSEQLMIQQFLEGLTGSLEERSQQLEEYISEKQGSFNAESISYLNSLHSAAQFTIKLEKDLQNTFFLANAIAKAVLEGTITPEEANERFEALKMIELDNPELDAFIDAELDSFRDEVLGASMIPACIDPGLNENEDPPETGSCISLSEHEERMARAQRALEEGEQIQRIFVEAIQEEDYAKAVTYAPAAILTFFITDDMATVDLFTQKTWAGMPTTQEEQIGTGLAVVGVLPWTKPFKLLAKGGDEFLGFTAKLIKNNQQEKAWSILKVASAKPLVKGQLNEIAKKGIIPARHYVTSVDASLKDIPYIVDTKRVYGNGQLRPMFRGIGGKFSETPVKSSAMLDSSFTFKHGQKGLDVPRQIGTGFGYFGKTDQRIVSFSDDFTIAANYALDDEPVGILLVYDKRLAPIINSKKTMRRFKEALHKDTKIKLPGGKDTTVGEVADAALVNNELSLLGKPHIEQAVGWYHLARTQNGKIASHFVPNPKYIGNKDNWHHITTIDKLKKLHIDNKISADNGILPNWPKEVPFS